jgi:hypothetical protein
MAEGPEDLVAEAMVISLFLLLAQKNPPEGILRILWRDPHPALGIYNNPVRRSLSRSHPAPLGYAEHRIERHYESTGRPSPDDTIPVVDMHIWLTVGDDHHSGGPHLGLYKIL